jgi:hypothetical protein
MNVAFAAATTAANEPWNFDLVEAVMAGRRACPCRKKIRTYSWWRPPRTGFGRIRPTV